MASAILESTEVLKDITMLAGDHITTIHTLSSDIHTVQLRLLLPRLVQKLLIVKAM